MHPTSTPSSSTTSETDKAMHISTDDVMKKRLEHQGSIRGAVIALSFGIALTVLLIIFAVFHCCCNRRSSRKRRKLNVNADADYLVDGMYL